MVTMLALLLLAPQEKSDAKLATLSRQRTVFQVKVVENKKYAGEERIAISTGGTHVQGYFPLGSSDRRYLVSLGGKSEGLLLQTMEKGKAQTKWRLPLTRMRGGKPQYRGTLGLMLHTFGLYLGKVTAEQKAILTATTQLAGYEYGGQGGRELAAWTVQKTGAPTVVQHYLAPKIMPIVESEVTALKWGKESWPTGLKFSVRE